MNSRFFLLPLQALLFAFLFHSVSSAQISLTGANGTKAQFAGVLEAQPKGLMLLPMNADKEIFVLWESFDLEALSTQHPQIYQAYQKAKSRNKTIPLRLGSYESMQSKDAFLKSLREALNQSHSANVPVMSLFFDRNKKEDYSSTSKSQDSNAAKRSKRFLKSYIRFLEDFFKMKDPQLSKQTVTWNWGAGSVYVITKEATPSPKTKKLSSMDILSYLGNDSFSGKSKAITYLQSEQVHINHLTDILTRHRKLLEDNQVTLDKTTRHTYLYTLEKVIDHTSSIRRSSSFNDSMERDIQTLIRELQL